MKDNGIMKPKNVVLVWCGVVLLALMMHQRPCDVAWITAVVLPILLWDSFHEFPPAPRR